MISIRVPARVCFFGDHQDYLGLPVIAGTIDRYLYLKAKPLKESLFRLLFEDLKQQQELDLSLGTTKASYGDYLMASLHLLEQKGYRFEQGFEVRIKSDIPINAGLSSSSALTIAWIRFLLATLNEDVTDPVIGQWAYEAEVLYFDNPGGLMDQYTIARQGLLFIQPKEAEVEKLQGTIGSMLIAESGLAKKTTRVLAQARQKQELALAAIRVQHPDFQIQQSNSEDYEALQHLLSADLQPYGKAALLNYHITLAARDQLLNNDSDPKILGALMNQHQELLEECIQNTPEPMKNMMDSARKAGALGAKIVGSGGGGCMVVLVEKETKQQVQKALLTSGALRVYQVQLSYLDHDK